jgi:hypothetical protein
MPTQGNELSTSLEFGPLLDQYSKIIEEFTPGEHLENSALLAEALRTYAVEPYLICGANVCNCFGSNNQVEPNEPVSFSPYGVCYNPSLIS